MAEANPDPPASQPPAGSRQTLDILRWSLPASGLLIIAVGFVFALSGSGFGWIVVGLGVFDLLTVPLVLRTLRSSQQEVQRGATEALSESAPAETDPTADPSYNPYAKED